MTHLIVRQFPCLSDNYGVLVHDPATGATGTIDAPDANAIIHALDAEGWTLTHVLTTHHHTDHTGGIPALKARYGCTVIGPAGEAARIPNIDQEVDESTPLKFGAFNVRVIETPGHTLGHIAYNFPDAEVVFVGDTLFSLGCGRMFEGDAEAMWTSLQKLGGLPDATRVYCGHEYTLANGRFALSMEPENEALKARVAEVTALRAANQPTVPTTIGAEKAANPFLRTQSAAIRARLGLERVPEWQVFQRLRELKNKG